MRADVRRPASASRDRAAATRSPRHARVLGVGLAATVGASALTTLVAALAERLGVVLEVPEGGETIPLSGLAVVTGGLSLVGVALALALLRWSEEPSRRFLGTTVVLTGLSLVPAFLSGGSVATVGTLVVLHLVAAGVVVPALTRALRPRR